MRLGLTEIPLTDIYNPGLFNQRPVVDFEYLPPRTNQSQGKKMAVCKYWLIVESLIQNTIFSLPGTGSTMKADPHEHLIIFTRHPRPGVVKTRLIPALGPEGAAALQREMTEHILGNVKEGAASRKATIEIRHEGGDESVMKNWLGQDLRYRPQGEGDLGIRMGRAFADAFEAGASSVVAAGSDIPDITGEIIQEAFVSLEEKDLVLGPAGDGGYYLIGLRRSARARGVPALFQGVDWGTGEVLEETMAIAGRSGIDLALLETLEDVDRPEDLPVWERARNRGRGRPGLVSIIIPTMNEANRIARTIAEVEPGDNREVIVVDGGSDDDTAAIARSLGARVFDGSPPKGSQMNLGASKASGEALLFLHADTRLPDRFDARILECLHEPGVAAGAFELRIDSPKPGLRLIERLANFRSHRMGMPYGDQGIFISAGVFRRIGGFPVIPIMEDFELMRRLKKKGTIATLTAPVVTSPRRWTNMGVLKTTIINQVVIAAHLLGVPPDVTARLYRREKGLRSDL